MDDRLKSAPVKVCVYLLLGALAVRLLYLSQYANSPFFWVPALDGLYHDLHARAIAAGQPEQHAFFRAPLYYYFLAGVYKVFGHSFWAARLIQALIGSASCVLLYQLGLRVFRPTIALIAGVMMALYGPLVFFDGELHTPVLEVFLDLAVLLLLLRAREGGPLGWWLLAGGVLGLSAITRPNILVAVPLVVAWIVLWRRSQIQTPRSDAPAATPLAPRALPHSAPRLAGVFLVGVVLAPGLVTLRNYRVSGDPVFIASQGGINMFLGNRPGADGFTPSTPARYRFESEYEDSVALYGQRAAEDALGRKLKASESQSYWMGRVRAFWVEQPVAAAQLTWRKAVLLWTQREIRNNQAFDFIRAEFAPALWACPIGFWLAGPLGVLGIFLAWRSHLQSRLVALLVPVYMASFVLFFVADRYRLPVVPLLLLFAAFALMWLWERARASEWRRMIPAGACLVALAVLVGVDWYRTATPAAYAQDHWCAGNRYRQMGRLPEAEAQYAKALLLDPLQPDFWTNLGAIQFGTGRVAQARESFGRAIALAPGSGSSYYNRAVCELALGQKDAARANLQQAVRLEPEHREARERLSRL